MQQKGFHRKLTAILSADVAGYTRLMQDDEAATVKTLEAYKHISDLVKQHRGRVVDSPGDNLLAEFASVVDAVQCAVAIQKELQARNTELPENRKNCLIIFAYILIFSLTHLNAQSTESESSLKSQDLVIEISCDKTEFIQGEPIDILIEIFNNSNDIANIYLNHYLVNIKNGSTSKHSIDRGITIPSLEKYYLFIDPAAWLMFLGSIDSAHSLKPGNYNFYVTTSYPNKKCASNNIILLVNPVPDSLLQAYDDLKYIPHQPRSIEATEKLLEKYKGSFYEERFYDKVFGSGFYYNAIMNKEDYKDYRNKALNLYCEFILKYPNSCNAYSQFRVIMYNYKDNVLLVNEILSSLNPHSPGRTNTNPMRL